MLLGWDKDEIREKRQLQVSELTAGSVLQSEEILYLILIRLLRFFSGKHQKQCGVTSAVIPKFKTLQPHILGDGN